ncbi:hypothetical protein VOLCADRAFT_104055 [Volvox carteri f. nagariensis]|uniref:Uncharacterized protein n=1 Tax=Volvox carteri f. nagariensis TaxID=3068 RepID=D8TQX7_VOLCA|nr:uncharacterized protein VOLCADRAFT_104055 [Volvox carteri f. nagariensis]EFJ50235.1 hypothetical protein VOLCADRAFT_104055 [Volvox carteri f. nagariensis]|eukprot:XP_002948855.1 hypothetical protein VOLCADRAFT_104055 [Volvox carteri f. nagariensis]
MSSSLRIAAANTRSIVSDDYASTRRPDEEYMKEYQALKDQLQDNNRKCGAVVAAYLLLTVDGQAALCALLGSAASYAYLSCLYRDVDSYRGDTQVPMVEADKVTGEIENTFIRRMAKVGCAYRQALQPRLLVPVALAGLSAAYNQIVGPERALDLLHQGCLLGGFLSYKLALLIKLADDLTPKTYVDSTDTRPRLEPIEDELDMFGRPKRRTLRMPTEVLPEGVEADKVPLAGLIMAADGDTPVQPSKLDGASKAATTGESPR